MAVTTTEHKHNSIRAQTEEGVVVNLEQEQVTVKTFYNVQELNGRISMAGLFETLGKVCKSGRDNEIIGKLLDAADNKNEVTIQNMSQFAKINEYSRESLKKLLKRAEENVLIHKIDTGHYLVNPFIIISKGLTAGGYAAQETAQLRWRELTGLITDAQLFKLIQLGSYLNVPNGLKPTEFNISVAEYYAKNGKITDKQKASIIKVAKPTEIVTAGAEGDEDQENQ